MKTKANKKITSVLLSLALMLSMMALPSMAMPVQAADAKIQTGLQNVVIGTGTNTTPTVIGFGGKQWVVIGYNGTGVNSQTGNMTLLLSKDSSYSSTQYDDTSSYSNVYSGSTLHAAMTSAGNTPLSEEQSLIIPVGLEGGSANKGQGGYLPNNVAGANVADQLFWPLSVGEANSLNDNVRMFSDNWWLRSAGSSNYKAAIVWGNGFVFPNGFDVSDNLGVRPAFKINLTSVIFSSSAGIGGKPTTVGANLSAATQPTAEQKLTVLDSTLAGFTAAPTGINGNSITLNYNGVGTTANRISAVVKDTSGGITHVGMLVSAPTANGTTTVELPSGFDPANDNLYIFAETVNAPNYTDYASDLVEIPVEAQAAAPTGLTGAPCTNTSNNDGKITSLTTDMEYSTDSINWTAVTGTELTGLSAGNYMVRYKEKLDSSTVYLASPTASVTIGTYTPLGTVATPTANPAGGQVKAGTTITLNVAESGATIHYTIDNSAPTTTSPVYSTPITVNSAMTIKAVAVKTGMTDSVIMDESYTIDSTPPTINHTITLGASGNGTVTGSGDYSENTTATVVATADTGWHFVSWTENGIPVVNAGATYSFTVTGNRSLVAEFAQGAPPPVPPVVTTSGRSSSSGGGTSKADIAPVAGRPFTKADATRLFNEALAAKPEGAATLSIKARNYTKVDKTVLAELAALAEKNGVTLTVHFDVVSGGKVTSRISVDPAVVATNLDLTVKIVGNKITLPKFTTPVEVAVKMPAGMTIENLKITQSSKDITATAKPWLDKNGYLHFSSTGGEIVLANK